jgi:hypothetical protein
MFLPQTYKVQKPFFKLQNNTKNMNTNKSIHDYDKRPVRARRSLNLLPNDETANCFLERELTRYCNKRVYTEMKEKYLTKQHNN